MSAALRQFVNGLIATWCSRLSRLTRVGTSSADTFDYADGLQMRSTDPEVVHKTRRMQHYGFSSRPPRGAEVVEMLLGGASNNRVTVAEYSSGPLDQEDGEVEIFATHGQRIRLRTDGSIVITPKEGQPILLGSADAADCDKVVTRSDLNTAMDSVVSRVNSHVHTAVCGTVGTTITTSPSTSPLTGVSVTGSPTTFATKP